MDSQRFGQLVYKPFVLTAPIERVPELLNVPARNPWMFPEWDVSETRAFIASQSLPVGLRQSLLEKIEERPEIEGTMLMPSTEEVLALPHHARRDIYNYLSRFRLNYEQERAKRRPCDSVREWMAGVDISQETLGLLESLSYRNGSLLFISDVALLLNRIPEKRERLAVFKALNIVETETVFLSAGNGVELDQLIGYWGHGGREQEVGPILESLVKEGGRIDLVHLMPNFVRTHLYQFPEVDGNWKHQDCHWTALNFHGFGGIYEEGVFENISDIIYKNYAVIPESQAMFGDLLVYLEDDEETRLIHSAIFICDELVFTKNGTLRTSPWMFMKMSHMDDYYTHGSPLRKMYLRLKPGKLAEWEGIEKCAFQNARAIPTASVSRKQSTARVH